MLKMVDGTGIIGVDMVCPLCGAASPPQPPNYDKVEVEGAGSLVLPNSLKAPLERVELLGTSVQGENPAPDNLQEIKSAGRFDEASGKYLFDVKVTGKNLFDINYFKEKSNLQMIQCEGFSLLGIICNVKPNTEYTLSTNRTEAKYNLNIANKTKRFSLTSSPSRTLVSNADGTLYIGFYSTTADLINMDDFMRQYQNIQLEEGTIATDYEVYQEPQTLTLTSDHPITKWDKLVEQGGEYGWLYGGKIIDSYNSEPIDTEYMSSTGQLSIGATVLYRLKEPEFIPLSESERTQLRSLHSYNGTTNITVDSGEVPCGIKLTYRKEK